jgi:hypothetical protein
MVRIFQGPSSRIQERNHGLDPLIKSFDHQFDDTFSIGQQQRRSRPHKEM